MSQLPPPSFLTIVYFSIQSSLNELEHFYLTEFNLDWLKQVRTSVIISLKGIIE